MKTEFERIEKSEGSSVKINERECELNTNGMHQLGGIKTDAMFQMAVWIGMGTELEWNDHQKV